jgi:retron-type reverse transcriptase
MPNPSLASVLARAFLAGEPSVDQICERGLRALGRDWRWLRRLANRYVAAHETGTRPRHRDVTDFILSDQEFRRALLKYAAKLSIAEWVTEPPRMQPVAAAALWPVPPIESIADLADLLSLYPAELDWFADLKGLCQSSKASPQLRHYHYRTFTKDSGGLRLIESPKPNLKAVQRRILTRILDRIPPHPAAHGFVKGRSIKTFAMPHVGQRVVLRMDLQDFFPTISGPRIQAFFRTAGYPEPVADLLGGLCTNATPRDAWTHSFDPETRTLYARPHLPQGAPTSPSLANLCAWRMDCRLAGLAKSAGATYTRYADDLAFSGGERFDRGIERFSTHVAAILQEEGFRVNHHKTRTMRQGARQHLAGLVVNERVNVSRADFDLLKATLTNCLRLGPDSQNRDSHPHFRSHLEGRISFVESVNPDRARLLRRIFDHILWRPREPLQ